MRSNTCGGGKLSSRWMGWGREWFRGSRKEKGLQSIGDELVGCARVSKENGLQSGGEPGWFSVNGGFESKEWLFRRLKLVFASRLWRT